MKQTASWAEWLRYKFENTLSAGPIAIIGWLAAVTAGLVLATGAFATLFRISPDSTAVSWGIVESVWNMLMRSFDPGTMADDAGWPLRTVSLVATLGGLLIVSTLIGTITAGIEDKIADLRRGRSRVLEQGHTLILGWSPKVYTIVNELCVANANQRRPSVVMLADVDKIDAEQIIKSRVGDFRGTRVICRHGNPLDLADLDIANPQESKSIIVLSPDAPHADAYVIKMTLALTNHPQRPSKRQHIVAEIRDRTNLEPARLVGGDEAIFVLTTDVLAKVTAQTCRQSGLSVVYQELLDFDGDEIYFSQQPVLTGLSFAEACRRFDSSAVIGILAETGEVLLNPPPDRRLATGDSVIVISEDDDTIHVTDPPPLRETALPSATTPAPSLKAEKTLVFGWNEHGAHVVQELEHYVAAGSEVLIVATSHGIQDRVDALRATLTRQSVAFLDADPTLASVIEQVRPEEYDHIVLLSNDMAKTHDADSDTLITLLHLRSRGDAHGRSYSIVTEMRDAANRQLAKIARADDFIISDQLISLMLSQISENRHLFAVFEDLFNPDGSEIYLKPAFIYVTPGRPVDFYDVLAAASARGETAIGYRVVARSQSADHQYGVVLNPRKRDTFTLEESDRVIVLAES